MLSEDQIRKLKSENEFLQIQLQDINEMIAIREEELDILRRKAKEGIENSSRLEGVYEELSYMQNLIGKHQQKAEGAERREASMEEEMLESIRMEREYYNIKEQFTSTSTALSDLNNQLQDAVTIYKQLADANRRNAELESKLDIAAEEKDLLNYELAKLKRNYEQLQKSMVK